MNDLTAPLQIEIFLNSPGIILDVRSPSEYKKSRIPGSINLPLFSDAERAIIGTLYKKVGQQQAIDQGLKFVGPKLADFVIQARTYLNEETAKVYCWRGGMRSASMAWLLRTGGIKTVTLAGGYKNFRQWALATLTKPKQINLLKGLTGSGKTAILTALKAQGQQILDLENLANHRGSSFGMLEMPLQPSSEQFENEIALQWSQLHPHRPVWIEDESRMIGTCKIPDGIFNQMQTASALFLERPLHERLEILLHDYGKVERLKLIEATQRLVKKLGAVRTKEIISQINHGSLSMAAEMLLKYYDNSYAHANARNHSTEQRLQGHNLTTWEWAQQLCTAGANLKNKEILC